MIVQMKLKKNLSPFITRVGKLFYEEPGSKYSQLCKPFSLCQNHSLQLCSTEADGRSHVPG